MNIAKIEDILRPIEEVLLDGEKFPIGRPDGISKRDKEIETIAPKIIEAYEIAHNSKERIPEELLGRVFYLARDIRKKVPHIHYRYTESLIEDRVVSERLREIANEGRRLSLANPQKTEERIKLAKLFSYVDDIFAAQLRDPKRGCSASICTNCDEPIAFCEYTCYTCNYELIGAHSMPTVEEWRKMDLSKRIKSLEKSHADMIADIHQRGDWRGIDSPLNRFKFEHVEWRGYSSLSGAIPLRKLPAL